MVRRRIRMAFFPKLVLLQNGDQDTSAGEVGVTEIPDQSSQ